MNTTHLPGKRLSSRFSKNSFKEIPFGGIPASDRKVASPKAFPRTARLGGEDVHVFVAGTKTGMSSPPYFF